MASVKFNLKNPKALHSLILARVYYDNKSFKLSTKQKIEVKYWNSDKQQARIVPTHRHHLDVNLALSILESKVKSCYISFQNKGISPTPIQIKNFLSLDNNIKFLQFFIDYRESLKDKKKNSQFKKNRYAIYHLENFFKHKNKHYDFPDLSVDFFNDFFEFMYSKNNMGANTLITYFQTIKHCLRLAESKGIKVNPAYKSPQLKLKPQSTDAIYLNLQEITRIYLLDQLSESLVRIRDVFIVGCFTGLRFSDYNSISYSNIKTLVDKGSEVKVISIRSQKVNQTATIPLHPYVKSIFDKYTENGKIKLPQYKSSQYFSQKMKDICKIAEIDEEVELVKSVGGKIVKIVMPKYKFVSSHTARRSLASNMFLAGIPKKQIMILTGHKSEVAFNRYLKISTEENALLLAKSGFFN